MRALFPYYGGKFNQLKDILGTMGEHLSSFHVVVDVFGGSGKVLLNIPEEWKKLKVYNDWTGTCTSHSGFFRTQGRGLSCRGN